MRRFDNSLDGKNLELNDGKFKVLIFKKEKKRNVEWR